MAITILRPNQEFTVKANVTRGDTQLVSWIIFSGHNSEPMNILQFYPKNGVELNHHFPDEGKFRMAAYHKEIQTKEDFQGSAELKHVDVEIKYNQLDGSKLAPKNSGEFLAGDALRKDFPAVFEAKFLINPPSQEEINRLQFVLEDGSGNTLNEGSHASNVFTFIPRNSNAKYTVKAIYTKESGETSQQTFSGVSKAISVRDITHGAEIVRPGTPMTFSVTQTQFGSIGSNSNFPEQGNIKWNLDKVLIGTGKSVTISGNQLMQKKKYHIEAYATSAIGNTKGSNTDNTKNDWHFEVKDNIVENIKVVKKPKFGIEGEFEIGKMTFPNYDAAKDGNISWKITGPENGSGSEAKLKKLFSVPGEYTISCSLGGRECKEPLKISILQPEVTTDKCKWIDRDNGSGNIITEAGINQEVCAFVSGNALDNENLTLTVYDDDSTGRTSVFNMTFQTEDKHKTGFYLPITISQDVVNGIKKSGFADYGDLYFNITRNGSELQVKNGDKKLGEFLRVSLEPKIINAYFCDANDTQQVFNSPLNGALYFKIYAINLVGRKAEINFITESDAYGSWDNKMKIGPWEDIKNKFKKERIRDTKPGTFNEKGEILVPVDLSKMGKPKNFIRLNAMVKILPDENAKEKQEEKGFYMVYTNLAILFPGATLPTIAENKGAVKVGRENIDGGNKKEDGICECEARVRAFIRMVRVGEGTGELIKSLKYNKVTKKNETVYITHDFQKGYTTAFAGNKITDLSTHPQQIFKAKPTDEGSSAAGAYQVMRYTWWELAGFEVVKKKKTGKYFEERNRLKKYKVTDYQPESQDKICIILMEKQRPDLINKIIANKIEDAIEKDGCFIWASLPETNDESHYLYNGKKQPATPLKVCIEHYENFLKEELADISPLHLKKGFLEEFDKHCCKGSKSENNLPTTCGGKTDIDLRSKMTFRAQKTKTDCNLTCRSIMSSLGVVPENPTEPGNESYYQTSIESKDHTKLILNADDFKNGMDYIDKSLEAGYPVMVGVNHTLNYGYNETINTSDHYVIIVGRFCDNNVPKYRFWDVATRRGAEGDFKFTLTTEKLYSDNVWKSGRTYILSQVRRNLDNKGKLITL